MAKDDGLVMDDSGRLRLPARLRRRLGYRGGTRLYPVETREGLLLRTREDAWRAAQGSLAHLGGRRAVADELIAERRAEQAREDAG
jgi:bifunctional DNA-binding transcriptional regulator/antitoxin component of YhaV-PrlF toxin-antitoxin module